MIFPDMYIPAPYERLNNGSRVIAIVVKHENRKIGEWSGVVLAEYNDEYVVWSIHGGRLKENEDTAHGHYFKDIDLAWNQYFNRGGVENENEVVFDVYRKTF